MILVFKTVKVFKLLSMPLNPEKYIKFKIVSNILYKFAQGHIKPLCERDNHFWNMKV